MIAPAGLDSSRSDLIDLVVAVAVRDRPDMARKARAGALTQVSRQTVPTITGEVIQGMVVGPGRCTQRDGSPGTRYG